MASASPVVVDSFASTATASPSFLIVSEVTGPIDATAAPVRTSFARFSPSSAAKLDAVQTLRQLLERQPDNAKARPLLERLTQQP